MKEKNYLIKNTKILFPDELKTGDLFIEDGVISGIGKNLHPDSQFIEINGKEKLVTPTFFNLHVHLGETIFRGKCDGMNLWEYLDVSHDTYELSEWKDKESEIHRLSGLVTLMECIENGTGYVVCNRGWEEVSKVGINGSCLFPIVNISKLKKFYDNLDAINEIKKEYEKKTDTSIFVQSLYLCDKERIPEIKKVIDSNPDMKLFIHISETEKEIKYVKKQFGCSPIQVLDKYGLLSERTYCVHSIYLNKEDYELLKISGAKVVLCPVSNLKLGDGFPNVRALLDYGIQVCIGTDGFATNNSASLLEELKVIGLMTKGDVKNQELFKMITCTPVESLWRDKDFYEIAVGRRANINIFSTHKYNLNSYNDVLSNLIYNNSSFNTEYVFSNGKILLENGDFSGFSKKKLISEYNRLLENLNYDHIKGKNK